jgi:hypothetical protein
MAVQAVPAKFPRPNKQVRRPGSGRRKNALIGWFYRVVLLSILNRCFLGGGIQLDRSIMARCYPRRCRHGRGVWFWSVVSCHYCRHRVFTFTTPVHFCPGLLSRVWTDGEAHEKIHGPHFFFVVARGSEKVGGRFVSVRSSMMPTLRSSAL